MGDNRVSISDAKVEPADLQQRQSLKGVSGGESLLRNSNPASASFFRQAVGVLILVCLALLIWQLRNALILLFTTIVVATAFRAGASAVQRAIPVGIKTAVSIVLVVVLLLAAAFVFFFGGHVVGQANLLFDQLPALLAEIGERLSVPEFAKRLGERAAEWFDDAGIVGDVLGFATGLFGVVANMVLAVSAGVYFAIWPLDYEEGAIRLFPSAWRGRIRAALDESGIALRHWLRAQLASMAVVGILTGFGLWLIGLHSALALGLLAGILEFIPFLGPFLSAVPAVLLAADDGWSTLLWVISCYVVVQQLEANLISPMAQRRLAKLPPIITIFSLIVMASLFGPLGVLAATPFAVVVVTLVRRLYLDESPGEWVPAIKRSA